MQINNIIEQQPKWTGVNITLTPREAYLLTLILGSTSLNGRVETVQTRLLCRPPRTSIPSEVLGAYTIEDENFLRDVYTKFLDALSIKK